MANSCPLSPLALVMGELGTRQPIGQLMIDLAAESVLGAEIAIVALSAIPERVPAPETIAG